MPDPSQPNTADSGWLSKNLPELMTLIGAFLTPLRFGRPDYYGQRHGPSVGAPFALLGPMLMKRQDQQTQDQQSQAATQKLMEALQPLMTTTTTFY